MPIYKADGKKDGLQKYNVRINYMDGKGRARQLTRTAYGLEAAKDLERKLAAEKKSDNGLRSRKMTVQELYEDYIDVKRYKVRESTLEKNVATMQFYILPTLKEVRIDRLAAQHLQEWKTEMERRVTAKGAKLSLRTKQHAYDNLNAMLNYAVKMEYLPKNPLKIVGNFTDAAEIKKDMQYYTASEFTRFIAAATEIARDRETRLGDQSEWDYCVFFCIAFYTGLRKGEIHSLKWSDISGPYLSVKRSVKQVRIGEDRETPPKNKSSYRTLQMPLPLIKLLEDHKERQSMLNGFSDDYRVCGGESYLRNNTINVRNRQYSEASGQKRIRLHDFRHSHVSVLANEGINIQEIARRLGHSRIEMTWNTYSHLYPREEEKAVDVLNQIA